MLLDTLGASLLDDIVAGKGTNRAGEGSIIVGYGSSKVIQIISNEIQKYYQNQPRFNGVYSRDNLPDYIKDGAYVINPDEYSGIGTHWIALYALINNATYFHSFGVADIPKEKSKYLLINL